MPQGWKMELAGIDGAAAKWDKAVEIAQLAEQLGYDSIWVYDHVHNVPRPAHEAVFECWTTMAAISQLTSTHPPRPDGRLQLVPQPGPAGEDHVDGRRDLRRPPRLGHRGRLVRARVPRLRLRVPEAEGPHRDAARDGRDRDVDVDASRRRRTRASTTRCRGPTATRSRCRTRTRRCGSAAAASSSRCASSPATPTARTSAAAPSSGRTSATCCAPTAPTSGATRTRSA